MRIFNIRDHEAKDIEKPLRELAANDDVLRAAKGQKLLELVRYLQAGGPTPELFGTVWGQELWLSKRWNQVSVRIGLDWQDYGPVQDGLPVMHYRIKIQRPDIVITTDERSRQPEQVERAILEAFSS